VAEYEEQTKKEEREDIDGLRTPLHVNLHCSWQKQWKDHTPASSEPLPDDHTKQQGGWERICHVYDRARRGIRNK